MNLRMDNIRTWCYNPGTEQRFQCNSQRTNTSSYRNINLANSPFAGGPNNRAGYFSVLSTGYVSGNIFVLHSIKYLSILILQDNNNVCSNKRMISGPSHSPFYDPSILGEFQRVNYQPPSTFVSHENLILPTTSFQYHSSTRDTVRYSAPIDVPDSPIDLLGTRSAPIEIPDSPKREQSHRYRTILYTWIKCL